MRTVGHDAIQVQESSAKLLLVVTGNFCNDDLVVLFEERIEEVEPRSVWSARSDAEGKS